MLSVALDTKLAHVHVDRYCSFNCFILDMCHSIKGLSLQASWCQLLFLTPDFKQICLVYLPLKPTQKETNLGSYFILWGFFSPSHAIVKCNYVAIRLALSLKALICFTFLNSKLVELYIWKKIISSTKTICRQWLIRGALGLLVSLQSFSWFADPLGLLLVTISLSSSRGPCLWDTAAATLHSGLSIYCINGSILSLIRIRWTPPLGVNLSVIESPMRYREERSHP